MVYEGCLHARHAAIRLPLRCCRLHRRQRVALMSIIFEGQASHAITPYFRHTLQSDSALSDDIFQVVASFAAIMRFSSALMEMFTLLI